MGPAPILQGGSPMPLLRSLWTQDTRALLATSVAMVTYVEAVKASGWMGG
jgi:hypothetical protein